MGKFSYRHLLMMPSFYLLGTFSVAYFMYLSGVVRYEPSPFLLHVVSFAVITLAAVSLLVFSPVYRQVVNADNADEERPAPGNSLWLKVIILFLLAAGLFGIYKYTVDFSRTILEEGLFFLLLAKDSGQIRTLSENVISSGTQLSYLSWMAAFVAAYAMGCRRLSAKWWLLIVVVLMANIVFVDRTRQIWVLFTAILCWFISAYARITRKQLLRVVTGLSVFFLVVFVVIGAWLGKVNTEEQLTTGNMPPELQPVFLYATSPYAYLGRLMDTEPKVDYNPQRLLYPAYKILSGAKLVEPPPSQVIEFFYLPFPANTGTFLEPYFADGGYLYLGLGIVIHTFVLDLLGLFFLRRRNYLSTVALSTLCFVNFMGFFTPKLTNLPTWLLLLPGVFMLVFQSRDRIANT